MLAARGRSSGAWRVNARGAASMLASSGGAARGVALAARLAQLGGASLAGVCRSSSGPRRSARASQAPSPAAQLLAKWLFSPVPPARPPSPVPVALAHGDRPELLSALGPGVLPPVPCTMHTAERARAIRYGARSQCAESHRALLAGVARALGQREEEIVGTRGRRIAGAVLIVFVVIPKPARALDLNAGVSLGGFLVGTVPRLAVSPHVGLSWRMENGLLFAVHDLFSVISPSNQGGIGIYNQTSIAIGYASKDVNFSAGPSFSVYSMTACGATLCGTVTGLAPGGQAQANAFFSGRLGISVSGYVNWVGGSSLVLPGGVAAMVVAGPVIRWDLRQVQ